MIDVCFFADEVSKDFDQAVKLGVDAGANAVEIRGGLWGDSVTTIDNDGVKRMQDVLAKYNAKVTCIGSPFGKCNINNLKEYETHRRYFDRMIELARAFETRIIRGFMFWNPNRKTKNIPEFRKVANGWQGFRVTRPDLNKYIDQIVEKMSPVARIAESANVTLSIENEESTLLGTCQEVKTAINALGNSPALTVCWDIMNGLHAGETPYPDGYNQIKGLVSHIHVKPNLNIFRNVEHIERRLSRDVFCRRGELRSLGPIGATSGTGLSLTPCCVTYQDLLTSVVDDGFSGSASIEHWGTPDLMLQAIRELRQEADQIQNKIRFQGYF